MRISYVFLKEDTPSGCRFACQWRVSQLRIACVLSLPGDVLPDALWWTAGREHRRPGGGAATGLAFQRFSGSAAGIHVTGIYWNEYWNDFAPRSLMYMTIH